METGHAQPGRPPRSGRHHRWRLIVALILLVSLLGGAAAFYYFGDEQQVRSYVQSAFEQLTGGQVELDHAELSILRQVRIKGLRVYLPHLPRTADNLVFAAGDVIIGHNWTDILRGNLNIKRIVACDALLQIWYDAEHGITNLQLMPFRQGLSLKASRPTVILRETLLQYGEITAAGKNIVIRQKISGKIKPQAENSDVYTFILQSADEGTLKSLSLSGSYDLENRHLDTVGDFQLESLDYNSLPARLEYWRRFCRLSRPRGRMVVRGAYDPATGRTVRLIFDDSDFLVPLADQLVPLHKVQAQIYCKSDEIIVERFSGRFDDLCRFDLAGTIDGYSKDAPFEFNLQTHGLSVPAQQWHNPGPSADASDSNTMIPQTVPTGKSESLTAILQVLPHPLQRFATLYSPTGLVDIKVTVQRSELPLPDSNFWQGATFEGDLTCHDAAGIYQHFPYALKGVQGELNFAPQGVTIGPLRARQGSQELLIEGNWRRVEKEKEYDLAVKMQHLNLDDKFYDALSPRHKQIWDQLEPAGLVNSSYHLSKAASAERCAQLDIELLDVGVRYRDFPLPLSALKGRLKWTKEQVEFRIDQGRAAGGGLTLTGKITPPKGPSAQLGCRIDFNDVLINDELAQYLSPDLREAYRKIAPAGRLDGKLHLTSQPQEHRREAFAEQDANSFFLAGDLDYQLEGEFRDGTIEYVKVPYRLQDVQAQFQLTNRHLMIDSLTGRHGQSRIDISGLIPQGGESVLRLKASPLVLDDDIRQLLGAEHQQLWDRLVPSGKVTLDVQLTRNLEEPNNGTWDIGGQFRLRNVALREPLQIDQINAYLDANAQYHSEEKILDVSAQLHSGDMQIKHRPCTDLSARISYAGRTNKLTVSDICGRFCDGRIAAQLSATQNGRQPWDYQVRCQVNEVNLAKLLDGDKPLPKRRPHLKGRFKGSVQMGRSPGDRQRRGSFEFVIADAVWGQLPIMAQLLHVLNFSPPKPGAFNTAAASGAILGRKTIFESIDLHGSALALHGAGVMADPNRRLELVFEVQSPHELPNIPLVSSFFEAIGPELLLLRVSGDFDKPHVEPVAFPTVEDALQQLIGNGIEESH